METFSIESKEPFSLEALKDVLSPHWRMEEGADNTLVVHGTGSRAYLYSDPDTRSGQAGTYRLLVDYSDVELAKALLQSIADDPNLIVDNDFGTVLTGSEFVARCKTEKGWNWRR